MYRTRSFRRNERNKAISRKKHIVLDRDGSDWYKFDGQYSKGSIECGCGSCKFGRKFGYPALRKERELNKFKYDLADYYNSREAS